MAEEEKGDGSDSEGNDYAGEHGEARPTRASQEATRHFAVLMRSTELDHAARVVAAREATVQALQAQLREAEESRDGAVAQREQTREELDAAHEHLFEPDSDEDVHERESGLGVGKHDAKWLERVATARECAREGLVADAIAADADAARLAMQRHSLVDARALGDDETVMVMPFSPPSNVADYDVCERTLAWARANPGVTSFVHREMDFEGLAKAWEMVKKIGLDTAALSQIVVGRTRLAREHDLKRADFEDSGAIDSGSDDDIDDDAIDSGSDDDIDDDRSCLKEGRGAHAWEAISRAVRASNLACTLTSADARRALRDDSSDVALYNPNAHFVRMASEEWRAAEPALDDSLRCCRLRARPLGWSLPEPEALGERATAVRVRRPLEIPSYELAGFDVEGDLIACCGDRASNELRVGRAYVGCMGVPDLAELERATTLGDLECSFDTNATRVFYDQLKAPKRERDRHFISALAEVPSDGEARVWAASAHCVGGCVIHGFADAARGGSAHEVARLRLPPAVNHISRKFVNFAYSMARCGDRVVAGAGIGQLSVWSIRDALSTFDGDTAVAAVEVGDRGGNEDADHDGSDDEDGACAAKVPKRATQGGMLPTASVNLSFAIGDCARLDDTTLVAAAFSSCENTAPVPTGLQVVDLAHERVVTVLCGHREPPALPARQLCNNLVFSVEDRTGTALVFDVRSATIAFALPAVAGQGKGFNPFDGGIGVLGVPTASASVAFGFGGDECIRAFDLRSPASQCYVVSTGNLMPTALAWHAPSASLLVATRNQHGLTQGRFSAYRYGDQRADDDILDGEAWPPRASFPEAFFPARYDASKDAGSGIGNGQARVLQYAFERT